MRSEMKTFTIETDEPHHGAREHSGSRSHQHAERFRSEAGLEKMAADWPMVKLVRFGTA
jgi:hypothetical protein